MESFGLTRFVKIRPPIRGKIKTKAESFKVTEILSDGFGEPPKKKAREVSHEPLSEKERLQIFEKTARFAEGMKELIETEEIEGLTNQKLDLGEFQVSKRREVYTTISKNWPWLEGKGSKTHTGGWL